MKRFVFIILVSGFFLNTLVANKVSEVSGKQFTPKDTTWKSLSIREKIGQTMVMLPDRKTELMLGNGTLEVFFKHYPVGAYLMV